MKPDNIKCSKCLGSGQVPNPATIGKRLKKERKAAGLSLTAIKTALRVSHGYVSLMENGKATITKSRVRQYRDAVAKLAKKGAK